MRTAAAIGIYGIMVNTVVRRTREIGLRLALGAAPRDAVTMILSNGMVLARAGIVAGLVAGLVAAIALMRFIRTLLFGVSPFDVPTFTAVVVLLALIAFVSAWAPAHAVVSALIHPFGLKTNSARPLLSGADVDPALVRILEKSCQDRMGWGNPVGRGTGI